MKIKSTLDLPGAMTSLEKLRAVVAASLVERSLPTPEIRGSNPNLSKIQSMYKL